MSRKFIQQTSKRGEHLSVAMIGVFDVAPWRDSAEWCDACRGRVPVKRDVRVVRKYIEAYGTRYPLAKAALQRWIELARNGEWNNTAEIQSAFAGAKVVNSERVRFEVAGGTYRMIVACNFTKQIAFIEFLGTHAEYDAVDAATVSRF